MTFFIVYDLVLNNSINASISRNTVCCLPAHSFQLPWPQLPSRTFTGSLSHNTSNLNSISSPTKCFICQSLFYTHSLLQHSIHWQTSYPVKHRTRDNRAFLFALPTLRFSLSTSENPQNFRNQSEISVLLLEVYIVMIFFLKNALNYNV